MKTVVLLLGVALALGAVALAAAPTAEAARCIIGPSYQGCIIGYDCIRECCGPLESCCYECYPE